MLVSELGIVNNMVRDIIKSLIKFEKMSIYRSLHDEIINTNHHAPIVLLLSS